MNKITVIGMLVVIGMIVAIPTAILAYNVGYTVEDSLSSNSYDWLPCMSDGCYTQTQPTYYAQTYTPTYNYSYPSCTPSTCAQRGYQCGSWNDGCSGTINCGSCGYNQICSGGTCVNTGSNCQPSNCSMLGYQCGSYSDGCGGTMYCGNCSGNSACSAGHCVGGNICQPQTCSQLGMQCGTVYDGCSGNINCGSCSGNQSCQNGRCVSTCSNQCTPGSTQCFGNGVQTCRDVNGDGCYEWDGVTNCGYNQTCQNGSCINSCQPRSCSQMGYQCGNFSDGCGNTINCGACGYGQSCQNGQCQSNCTDQCSQGDRRCTGNGYQVCGQNDGNNCDSWGQTLYCDGNQECSNGYCQNNYQPSNFSVSLYASPNNGCAPLDNVSLTATVSGYSNNYNYNYNNGYGHDGEFTYYFSCDGNGTWDRTVTTSNTSATVTGICDGSYYRNSGNHAARVRVVRDGYEATDQTQINVRDCNINYNTNKQLKVALYTDPTNGCTPLNGVSLRALVTNADVSGYNVNYDGSGRDGGLTYSFDCDNNGTFEKTVTSNETEVVVNNLCSYPASGKYTARVRVTGADGQWATDTAIVKVNYCQNYIIPPAVYVQPTQPVQPIQMTGALSVLKTVANMSSGTQYQQAVTANPGDIVSFRITIDSNGTYGQGMIVNDIIPAGIVNPRDLTIDGQSVAGNIASGVSIGDLIPNTQRVVAFTATVAPASNFPYGQTALTDTAAARNSNVTNSSTATVYVWRQAVLGATKVSTGIIDSDWMNYLVAAVIAGLAGIWLFREKLTLIFNLARGYIDPSAKKI